MTYLRQLWAIAWKDLLIEVRNCLERARLPYGLGQAYRSRAIGWALEEFFRDSAPLADN